MKKKILIIGAGVAGKDVLNEIKKNPDLNLDVKGLVDDNPKLQNQLLYGVKILGGINQIPKFVKKLQIEEVIIAIPSAEGNRISDIVKLCSKIKVKFRIIPRVKEIIEGKAHVYNVRKVEVEDLLGRPVNKEDINEMLSFFDENKVLVTGAAGSIGSELSRQIAAYKPKELILLDWWEYGMFQLQLEFSKSFPECKIRYVIGNVQDYHKIKNVMVTFKPDYVFHAAAYKHVPLMEDNPEEAVKNTIFGTLCVAKESSLNSVKKFVLVSSDKATNPANVMGMCKLLCEAVVKNLNGQTKFITVRFGNVLDSYGSVIPIFRKQIEEGGPITITDKRMTRYFMTIPEASQLILKSALLGRGGELFVLDMGKPVKIVELAENLIRLSGFTPNVDIKIKFIGIRKGEKLNELLFTKQESLTKTRKDKIYTTKNIGIKAGELEKILTKLRKFADDNDRKAIKKEFERIKSLF